MRILALDPGTKRIGVAASDETGTLASPLEFIPAEPVCELVNRIRQIIEERRIGIVLVGIARNMDGSYGPSAEKGRAFAAQLEQSLKIPVKLWDERLTSLQANRMLLEAGIGGRKRRHKTDQTAAAVLLQSYLDAQNG